MCNLGAWMKSYKFARDLVHIESNLSLNGLLL
jgi:hypothetical protein